MPTVAPPQYFNTQFFDANGDPAVGYLLFSYAAWTSTKQATYTDSTGNSANTNPIVLDSRGECNLWVDVTKSYKFRLCLPTESDPPSSSIKDWNAVGSVDSASEISFLQAGTGAVATTVQAKLRESVSVKDFGAVGDGATDDTAALIAVVAAMPATGATLYFPPGIYLVNTDTDYGVLFSGKSNFHIFGNRATIKVKNADPCVTNGIIVTFDTCSDGIIEGLTLDGNRANRTPNGANAMCLYIHTSTARLHFKDVRAINSPFDGIYVATATPGTAASVPTDIILENCEADNCYRNGLSSINSLRLKIIGGSYHNTTGSAPQSGIDLEDSGTYGNVDPIIEGVRAYSNAGHGMQISGSVGTENSQLRDIYCEGNTLSALTFGLVNGILLDNVEIGPHGDTLTRGLVDFGSAASTDITINNLRIHDITATGTTRYAFYVHASVTGPLVIDGISFKNIDCVVASIATPEARISNITVNTSSITAGGAPGHTFFTGARTIVRNMVCIDTAHFVRFDGADSELDGFTSIDCSRATNLYFNLTTNGILRNAQIIQTSALPAASLAIYFTNPPKQVVNVSGRSAGTDFTADQLITFAGGVTGAVLDNIALAPYKHQGVVNWTDDFFGDVLADQWNGRVGTDPQCVAPAILTTGLGGVVRMTTGDDAAATMAVNGVQLESLLQWQPDSGGLVMEARVKVDNITTVCMYIGFTDQVAVLEMPFTLAGGDVLTAAATDAVGVLFDTAAATDNWWCVGVANGVNATKINAAAAPVNGVYTTWRISVSATGTATFSRNGVMVGSTVMSGATRATIPLTPVIAAFSRAASSRNIDCDVIVCQQNR